MFSLFFMVTNIVATIFIRSSPSDGTIKDAQCQGLQPPWHAKGRFPDVRKKSRLTEGPQENLKISNPTKHFVLYFNFFTNRISYLIA
jgi:hypothetical protein